MRHSKRYSGAATLVDPKATYGLESAVGKLKEGATAKFDETAEVTFILGIRSSQVVVRGTCSLPNGTGKTVRILAFAKGEAVAEAEQAGADFVGGEDLSKKIQDGWLETDVIIATPDMMSEVGKLGRLLGPRGLMPNPKSGTVTFDVGKAVRDVKAGKIEFRTDKTGNIHVPVGKRSFSKDQLVENIQVFMETIVRAKPATSKGQYVRSVTISSTMGPGVSLDANLFRA